MMKKEWSDGLIRGYESLVDIDPKLKEYSLDPVKREESKVKSESKNKFFSDWNFRFVFSQKRKVSVQLYCKSGTANAERAIELLEHKLTKMSLDANIALETLRCKNVQEPENMPTIVLCINGKRLDTCLLENKPCHKIPDKTALIVLHIKEPHALPCVPSEKKLVGQEYRALARIIDLAYLPDTGFYTCDMNIEGFKQLIEFIKNIPREEHI